QDEERTLFARRFLAEKARLRALFRCMKHNPAEPAAKVTQLKTELGALHQTNIFKGCVSMGDIVERHIEFMLGRHLA
ncbi:MAG: hypothetical protein ABIZ56_07535, partial [Chthoniobacteraceae bacterium]